MASQFSFAVPSAIPQDLQLIQDILGDIVLSHSLPKVQQQSQDSTSAADDEHGTDSDTESEKEVEANILGEDEAHNDGCVSYLNPSTLTQWK